MQRCVGALQARITCLVSAETPDDAQCEEKEGVQRCECGKDPAPRDAVATARGKARLRGGGTNHTRLARLHWVGEAAAQTLEPTAQAPRVRMRDA